MFQESLTVTEEMLFHAKYISSLGFQQWKTGNIHDRKSNNMKSGSRKRKKPGLM